MNWNDSSFQNKWTKRYNIRAEVVGLKIWEQLLWVFCVYPASFCVIPTISKQVLFCFYFLFLLRELEYNENCIIMPNFTTRRICTRDPPPQIILLSKKLNQILLLTKRRHWLLTDIWSVDGDDPTSVKILDPSLDVWVEPSLYLISLKERIVHIVTSINSIHV